MSLFGENYFALWGGVLPPQLFVQWFDSIAAAKARPPALLADRPVKPVPVCDADLLHIIRRNSTQCLNELKAFKKRLPGFDVNVQDAETGNTALHEAVLAGCNEAVIEWFLEQDAISTTIENRDQETAGQLANRLGKTAAMEAFSKYRKRNDHNDQFLELICNQVTEKVSEDNLIAELERTLQAGHCDLDAALMLQLDKQLYHEKILTWLLSKGANARQALSGVSAAEYAALLNNELAAKHIENYLDPTGKLTQLRLFSRGHSDQKSFWVDTYREYTFSNQGMPLSQFIQKQLTKKPLVKKSMLEDKSVLRNMAKISLGLLRLKILTNSDGLVDDIVEKLQCQIENLSQKKAVKKRQVGEKSYKQYSYLVNLRQNIDEYNKRQPGLSRLEKVMLALEETNQSTESDDLLELRAAGFGSRMGLRFFTTRDTACFVGDLQTISRTFSA